MGIAAEIGQHLFGAAEWWLGVDHPVEAPEFAETTCEGLRFDKAGEIAEEPQLAGREGVLQLLQEQPAEQPREHTHRQEEAGTTSDPVGGSAANTDPVRYPARPQASLKAGSKRSRSRSLASS